MANSQQQNDNEQRENLIHQLEEIRRKAEQLTEIGSNLKKAGTYISDLATEGMCASPHISPNENLTSLQLTVSGLNNFLTNGMQAFSQIQAVNASGYFFHGTQTLNAFNQIFTISENNPVVPSLQPTNRTWDVFSNFTSDTLLREQVIVQIERLKLHLTQEGVLLNKQLRASWDTYLESTKSPTPSLITMREAINLTISELLKKRKNQKKVTEKIVEIGTELGASYAQTNTFKMLQAEWDDLNNKLSGSKKGNQNRSEEQKLIRQGTNFLVSLLSALDPTKMR